MIRPALSGVVIALAVIAALLGGGSADPAAPARCGAPPSLVAIEPALTHAATRIDRGDPLKIVAVGSSSTSGTGASAPDLAYPARLAAELRARFPGLDVVVVNRGKGGEDAPQMMKRRIALKRWVAMTANRKKRTGKIAGGPLERPARPMPSAPR